MKFENNVQARPARMVTLRNRCMILTAVITISALILYSCTLSIHKSSQQLEFAAYPHTYSEYVEASAKEFHVEPALVYAVIKQESGFDANCVSDAGAVGLMQIMPKTFQWLSESMDKIDKKKYTEDDMYDPKTNIRFGCRYLSVLLRMYSKPATALAAYNAGMGNVSGWLKNKDLSSDGKTLRKIPFPETSAYTKKVLDNYVQYKQLYRTQSAPSSANKWRH